jgi:hypothetical protein
VHGWGTLYGAVRYGTALSSNEHGREARCVVPPCSSCHPPGSKNARREHGSGWWQRFGRFVAQRKTLGVAREKTGWGGRRRKGGREGEERRSQKKNRDSRPGVPSLCVLEWAEAPRPVEVNPCACARMTGRQGRTASGGGVHGQLGFRVLVLFLESSSRGRVGGLVSWWSVTRDGRRATGDGRRETVLGTRVVVETDNIEGDILFLERWKERYKGRGLFASEKADRSYQDHVRDRLSCSCSCRS